MTCSVGKRKKKKRIDWFPELYAQFSQGDLFAVILQWTFISFLALQRTFRSISSCELARRVLLCSFHIRRTQHPGVKFA